MESMAEVSIAFSQLTYVALFCRRLLGKLDRIQIAGMVYRDGKEYDNSGPKREWSCSQFIKYERLS